MKTTLEIQNLKCGGCENTIKRRLSDIENIENITIDIANCLVTFNHRTDREFRHAKHELARLGYPVAGEENNFSKKAKSYVSCATGRINKK